SDRRATTRPPRPTASRAGHLPAGSIEPLGGVGFSELLLLALITLLVVGPQRLPEVARTVGGWTRQARHAWASLKSEFQAEMDRDHNRRILDAERAGKPSESADQESHERQDRAD